MPNDDLTLLREYAAQHSEPAFAALVDRHVNLVYSVALRSVRDPHLAEEATQAVFIILARKADALGDKTILSGWLCRTARHVSTRALRTQIRRQQREHEAHMQTITNEPESETWTNIAPLLDGALDQLGPKDHDALVLRFFENKNFAEVGAVLGASEDAAKMRVQRALEKLRKFFTKRGVVSTTAIIAGAISANSIQAAPVGLAKTISAVAVAKGAAAGTTTLLLVKGALKIMAWTKVKTAVVIGLGILFAAGTTAVVLSTARHQDRVAMQILEQTMQKYSSLSNYSSSGVTVHEIKDGEHKPIIATFTMRLGRPDLYFVEYEQDAFLFTNKGTIWSSGNGNYFSNHMARPSSATPPGAGIVTNSTKSPFPGLEGAARNLGMIADVSGGVSLVVPSLFFGIQIPDNSDGHQLPLILDGVHGAMARVMKMPDESVGKTDCYVLQSETSDGKAMLWIGKQDFLVHQSQQMWKMKEPDFTDEDTRRFFAGVVPESAKKALSQFKVQLYTNGVESQSLPLQELTRRINDAKKEAYATMKPVSVVFSGVTNVSGIKSVLINPPNFALFTQTHENIVVNQVLSRLDFEQ